MEDKNANISSELISQNAAIQNWCAILDFAVFDFLFIFIWDITIFSAMLHFILYCRNASHSVPSQSILPTHQSSNIYIYFNVVDF